MARKAVVKRDRHSVTLHFSNDVMQIVMAAAEADHRTVKNYLEVLVITGLPKLDGLAPKDRP